MRTREHSRGGRLVAQVSVRKVRTPCQDRSLPTHQHDNRQVMRSADRRLQAGRELANAFLEVPRSASGQAVLA